MSLSAWKSLKASDRKLRQSSTSSQTTFEDDPDNWRDYGIALRKSAAQSNQKQGEDSLNTSGSSLSQEVINNALSNLEFLSDEDT